MQISIDQIIQILKLNPQIKIKIANTFFALTLCSYYIAVHHTPKILSRSQGTPLFELESNLALKGPQGEEAFPLISHSRHGLVSHDINFSKSSLAPVTLEVQGEISTNKVSHIINNPSTYWRHPREREARVGDPVQTIPSVRNEEFSYMKEDILHFLRNESLPWIPDSRFALSRMTPFLGFPQLFTHVTKVPLSSDSPFIMPSVFGNVLLGDATPVFKPLPPAPPESDPSVTLIDRPSLVSLSQTDEGINSNDILPASPLRSKVHFPVGTLVQNEEKGNLVVENVKTESQSLKPESEKKSIREWNQYIVESKDPVLRFWLMKLAPTSQTLPEEIPFRLALVEMLLSPNFQPYVNQEWENLDNWQDEPIMKARRRDFHNAYMEKVEWSETPFERLFLTPAKDWHQVNEDAYEYAYDLPLKVGVRLYRNEDICDF